jgi:hypothetical protein
METVKGLQVRATLHRRVFLGVLLCLVTAFCVTAKAQTAVEEKLKALEAHIQAQDERIQQLESELADSRENDIARTEMVMRAIKAPDASPNDISVRPAVLTGPSNLEFAPASAAAPSPAPPQQESLTGELEGLNFFKGVKFGGFLDAYYNWDFNEPADAKVTNGGVGLNRNFDFNHNSLTLSQADFEITKAVSETSPLGYMLQMTFGPTADWVNSGDFSTGNSTAAHFMQYYLSGRVPVGRGLTLDFGKFVNQHGAEVIDTRADWNYSRGLLFALAVPYYHFGVRAVFPVSDKVTVAAYLVNGWNNVIDNNGGKTGGFQFIWNPSSRVSFIQNYMLGPEQAGNSDDIRHMFDSILTLKLHDKVTFMANYDYGMDRVAGTHVHWQGIAGYLKFQATPRFSLTPRFEFFSDPMGASFITGTRQQLKEFTITPEFVISNNLVTRFEYRHDWSNEPTFAIGSSTKDPQVQDTAAVGLILKF